MKLRTLTWIACASILFACNSEKKEQTTTDSITAPAASVAEAPATEKVFDISTIPVSDKTLGDFPYFSLPEDYQNFSKHEVVDHDIAYFWVKDHYEKPEGKIFYNRITAKEGKSYSDLVLAKHLDEAITAAGGVKVSEMKIPSDSTSKVPENNALKYMDGYGFVSSQVTTVYLIRRADKNIWIQFTPTDDGVSAAWMVLETKG